MFAVTGWNGNNFSTIIDIGDPLAKSAAISFRKQSVVGEDCTNMTLGIGGNGGGILPSAGPMGYIFRDDSKSMYDNGFSVVPLGNGTFRVERLTNLGGNSYAEWRLANKRCTIEVVVTTRFY
jgi:hypothetical protein